MKKKKKHISWNKRNISQDIKLLLDYATVLHFFYIYLFIAVSKTSCFAHRVQLFEFIESGQNNHIKH